MLSIETRVNGELIGCAHAVRKMQAYIDDDKKFYYYVEYHKIGLENRIVNFRVIHNPEEGAEKLILKVYQELAKILKREENTQQI